MTFCLHSPPLHHGTPHPSGIYSELLLLPATFLQITPLTLQAQLFNCLSDWIFSRFPLHVARRYCFSLACLVPPPRCNSSQGWKTDKSIKWRSSSHWKAARVPASKKTVTWLWIQLHSFNLRQLKWLLVNQEGRHSEYVTLEIWQKNCFQFNVRYGLISNLVPSTKRYDLQSSYYSSYCKD